MIFRYFIALFAFSSCSVCNAQAHLVCSNQLDDDNVADVYTIGDMAFVIRQSAILDSRKTETDISKLISPADAVKNGLPTKSIAKLIDRLLHGHHEPDLQSVSAVENGGAGFFWKLKWYLFPSPGGFSGIPYEYHAIVRSDGTQVKPELYLCDSYGAFLAEPEDTVFSVLALEDLLQTTKTKVDIEQLKLTAENTFNDAFVKFDIDQKFKTLSPQRITFHSGLTSKKDGDVELEVWAVRFVHDNIENPKNISYVGSIVVWVTSDLLTSELTMETWDAKSKR